MRLRWERRVAPCDVPLVDIELAEILVHADFEDEMTWPFRDSGEILLASQVPPDASVVIWPTTVSASCRPAAGSTSPGGAKRTFSPIPERG